MTSLASEFSLKGLTLKNRIVMPPMCQYSVATQDGRPNDWHFVHYVSRAVGGVGLILLEATAVAPDGRITNNDLGLWSDDHVATYRRLVDEVHKYGAKIGVQINHAGRKAKDAAPSVGPSAMPLPGLTPPRALTAAEAKAIVVQFQEAAARAVLAGFDTVELHGAHGYLIHQFHSPGINDRNDEYGRDLSRFGSEVIRAVRGVLPASMPLVLRISAIEYMDGGYGLEHSLKIARHYQQAGVDLFHVSSGGEAPPGALKPGNYPGYQLSFARAFKEALQVPVIAVGKLEDARLAQSVLANQEADLIAVGRGMLDDPYWALHAINQTTGSVEPPVQYERGIRPLRKSFD